MFSCNQLFTEMQFVVKLEHPRYSIKFKVGHSAGQPFLQKYKPTQGDHIIEILIKASAYVPGCACALTGRASYTSKSVISSAEFSDHHDAHAQPSLVLYFYFFRFSCLYVGVWMPGKVKINKLCKFLH